MNYYISPEHREALEQILKQYDKDKVIEVLGFLKQEKAINLTRQFVKEHILSDIEKIHGIKVIMKDTGMKARNNTSEIIIPENFKSFESLSNTIRALGQRISYALNWLKNSATHSPLLPSISEIFSTPSQIGYPLPPLKLEEKEGAKKRERDEVLLHPPITASHNISRVAPIPKLGDPNNNNRRLMTTPTLHFNQTTIGNTDSDSQKSEQSSSKKPKQIQ